MKNKRIAMFCHDDPLAVIGSQESGGQAVYVLSLIRELDKQGWETDAYVRLDSPHKKQIATIGKKSRLIRLKCGPAKYIPRKIMFDFLPAFYSAFLNFINKSNTYNIFHGHYWDGGWLAMKAHKDFFCPLVENFHSIGKIGLQAKQLYSADPSKKDIFDKRFLIEREIANESDFIITLSESENECLQKDYGVIKKKIAVIPGGVNTKTFSPQSKERSRQKLRLEESKFVVLFIGRLEWRKGIGTLIHAIRLLKKEIPNIELVIIGGKIHGKQKNIDDYKEYQRLLAMAKEGQIDNCVRFLGCAEHNLLPYYYSAADVFVIPSYYEPFGLVTLESMACKAPVIASNVGGLSAIIKDGIDGLLFEPRNPVSLSEKILKLYNSKKMSNDLATTAYAKIMENYSWKEVSKQIIDIYCRFIDCNINEPVKHIAVSSDASL